MANWTDEAKEKARETRRANKAAKAAAAAAREAELQALREEVERLRAGTPTVVRQVLEDRAAVISDQKGLLTDKAAQLFKAHADNLTLSNGLSAARDEIGDLVMIVADRDAQIARLRLESDEMQDEIDATNIYAGEMKEKLDRRSPAGGISASTVTMAINILRTASDTLALALEDDGRTEDDNTQNPERVRTTENGKTNSLSQEEIDALLARLLSADARIEEVSDDRAVEAGDFVLAEVKLIKGEDERILEAVEETVLMPTTLTIKSSPKVTEEDLLNDDPIFPFSSRPSDVAAEITEVEDERILEAVTMLELNRLAIELEERAEENLNAHPYLVPPPPLEQRTMLELNRLAIELGISPSGNKPHLVRLLNEAAGKEKQ